jgi:hypothetical protein
MLAYKHHIPSESSARQSVPDSLQLIYYIRRVDDKPIELSVIALRYSLRPRKILGPFDLEAGLGQRAISRAKYLTWYLGLPPK